MLEEKDNCPHCGSETWDGFECLECGFADDWMDDEITIPCPSCGDAMPVWADEDIGLCITCWDKKNKGTLTNQ